MRTLPALAVAAALSLATVLSAPFAQAQQATLGIAAVVNDTIITSADLENRLRFILATTSLSDAPETREKLKPQVLRQLVDEALQLQEADRENIGVSEEEITQAIAAIEQQRGMPQGAIASHLKKSGVPEESFRAQVKAQLLWNQVTMRKLRPLVRVSEEEVDRARLKQEETPAGVTADEVKISVLALPVEKPAQEAEMRALAEKLVMEIQRGVSFETLARELSSRGKGATAPFWVAPAQMDPAIAKALEKISPGQITLPIRTAEGYTLVQLLDRRGARALATQPDMEVLLKDVLMKLKEDAAPQEVDVMLEIARSIARSPGSCTEAGIAGVGNTEEYDIHVEFRRLRTSEMTDAVNEIVDGLGVGSVSQPFATPEGIRFFMLCERVEAPPKLADRDATYNRLMQEKLALEAEKYMRNLRREAIVEVRQ